MDASGIERITKHNVQVDDVVGYFCPTGAPPIYHTVIWVDRFADAPAVTFEDGIQRYLPLGIDHRLIGRVCRSADELKAGMRVRVGGLTATVFIAANGNPALLYNGNPWFGGRELDRSVAEGRVIILAEQAAPAAELRTTVTEVDHEAGRVTYTTGYICMRCRKPCAREGCEACAGVIAGGFTLTKLPAIPAEAVSAHPPDDMERIVRAHTCRSCGSSPCEYSCARGGWARYEAERKAVAEARERVTAQTRRQDAKARAHTDELDRGRLGRTVEQDRAFEQRAAAREASAAAVRPFMAVVR